MNWKLDPERSRILATTTQRDQRNPPHWLRCEFVSENDKRCRHGADHSGDHEEPKPPLPPTDP